MAATYSGPLRRPSILSDETPTRTRSGTSADDSRSSGESRYARSPTGVSTPSTTSSYGNRQACAQAPRFALRPPMASLVRHCPEYEMHSAPCTKTSTSTSVPARTCAMSSSESSRARITRVAPTSRASSTDEASVHVICVEAWIGRSGAMARARRATPRSWTITASTPASAHARTAASTLGSSASNTSVLSVT